MATLRHAQRLCTTPKNGLDFVQRCLLVGNVRNYATELPRPPPPTRQPVVEVFSGPSRPRKYYARPGESAQSQRELPKPKRTWPLVLAVASIGLAGWASFLTYATNSEKIASSVFRSIVRAVREDPQAKEVLGEAIRPQPEWWLNGDPYVTGQIGQLQGNIDVSFRIRGTKGSGTVYFTSIRKEKGRPFTTLRFKVICDDGPIIHVAG
ncbi:hypothetical protein AMATHDRAFT_157173 [Amanita thiersii Skay4041]|uniref:DUF1783-domain-containing protein n=1 Tax=Amanita thiersii Skay4041 TaxID=703135 RepID=A0A2A9N9J7_9AGAR|nr:hypothetical protein AMATHDRAFT_157173 [Amanita thiersii Skay4041]